MSVSKTLTSFLTPFIQQLYVTGVRDVVVSPGSRSTPLTILFREHPGIQTWINVDERSAAFFALGIAKGTKRPVALVCSSGTASANYFPAIIEARYSEVPLIVLTADRPHELREVGAPQAIDQIKMYGSHVKASVDLPLPEPTEKLARFMAQQASVSAKLALEAPKGPVHLNFPFRDPLMPDLSEKIEWGQVASPYSVHPSENHIQSENVALIANQLMALERPLIVVGPEQEKELGEKIHQLADRLKAPVLVDPLSQLRSGPHSKTWMIEGYDTFLRGPDFVKTYQADGLLRFGPMPISKPFLQYSQQLTLKTVISVSEGGRPSDPTLQVTEWVKASPLSLIDSLITYIDKEGLQPKTAPSWSTGWVHANELTRELTEAFMGSTPWFEGHIINDLMPALPAGAQLFASNSMPIRDLDSFFCNTNQSLQTFGNRGANGIDGINSTGLGLATNKKPTYLVVGDLSFFHDTNGLMVGKQYDLDLTVIVVNNNGGGIFSFLPQSGTSEHFEELFATPLSIEVKEVAQLYKAHYFKVSNRETYKEALRDAQSKTGLKLIECFTNRAENVAAHKAYWETVQKSILEECLIKPS